jgi:hypothetical protein
VVDEGQAPSRMRKHRSETHALGHPVLAPSVELTPAERLAEVASSATAASSCTIR